MIDHMKPMKKLVCLTTLLGLLSCNGTKTKIDRTITDHHIQSTIELIIERYGSTHQPMVERGVKATAVLWTAKDGNSDSFTQFCIDHWASTQEEKQSLYYSLAHSYETLWGYYGIMDMHLREKLDLKGDSVRPIDELFGQYSPSAHLIEDLFNNKIAFITTLNFPPYTLKEKNTMGLHWSDLEWAYARMGELFTERIPSSLNLSMAQAASKAESYISEYNIMAGELVDENNQPLFPKGMTLLSHWNLRDEIKANYADKTPKGLKKQEAIYQVMNRIIDQSIPLEVINNTSYQWNPFSNTLFQNHQKVSGNSEGGKRYGMILSLFKEELKQDSYCNEDRNTYIKRKFDGEMEISQEQVEKLFIEFLSDPQGVKVGKMIEQRLGRKLRPFDLWYDGFKTRSTIDEKSLTSITTQRYPDADAFKKNIPSILTQLGFSNEMANYLSDKIEVDAARGSGHARGGTMRGDKAHLRTRIPDLGMDYKGFNIAIHELGHNVEQTLSLYNVEHYMLNGVPNTSFTEALAFIFQSRDLTLLGKEVVSEESHRLTVLDSYWSMREIMGVSLVDMRMWKWLYAHPNCSEKELNEAVLTISKEVWNDFFAPIYGIKDVTLLAIYSHMVSYPLYLSAYSFGQLIEFQLENHLQGKDFAKEIERIYSLGRLTPDVWMQRATGELVSIKPLLNELKNYTE